ncbi:Protein CBG11451 [Caenorhabditis briggsae]|uniref:Protein CBG11451 n=1 Tax=Caenorhabditis briggsae TaxID=6238 RepID=A8XCZ7_CAEBR|nr:Protein CBG11451 [Caenorhabditis briggsae]CAP30515.1 Protein CBG11451 [Caenorhabditis briggsae]
MDQIDMESPHSKWQTSGNVSWTMGVVNTKNEEGSKTEKLKAYIKCHLEPHIETLVEENWHLEADYVIRLNNHSNSNKNVYTRGSTSFSKTKEQNMSSLIKISDITDDFLLNDELTFEVEIGVKSSEGLPKSVDFLVKRTDSNAILTVGKEKFYVDKEVLSKNSTVFEDMFKSDGTGKAKNEYPVDDVNPETFHLFVKLASDVPMQFDCEFFEYLKTFNRRACHTFKFKLNHLNSCARYQKCVN